ncbi:MAG: erythromycin esterase family protein [Umezawaea sp.]
MSQDIMDFVTPSCELLAFGEPTHQEPAFQRVRGGLLARLVDHGFRSIVLETDQAAAMVVDDFVREGVGTLDEVVRDGFSHRLGELETNRELVVWLREHNEGLPAEERVAFHGFDLSTEMMSAPSPRRHLERARDYLGLDVDFEDLLGEDERWSRTEAVMDWEQSIGATADAGALRVIADDMLVALHVRTPELVGATSLGEWRRVRTILTAGLGLLRYHRELARPGEQGVRISRLSGVRDGLMARNLLDIREVEGPRGKTFVFAHNLHLKRNRSEWRLGEMDVEWVTAGAIVAALVGERYAFVAGSVGRSDGLGLGEPEPDSAEGLLQSRCATWGLTAAGDVRAVRGRTGTIPEKGYFPLDQALLDGADAVLHIGDVAAV